LIRVLYVRSAFAIFVSGSGMRLLSSLLLASLCSAANFHFFVAGSEKGGWQTILSSIGMLSGGMAEAGVVVVPAGTTPPAADWAQRVEKGAILVVEGESGLAASFGFKAGAGRVLVRSVEDIHAPKLKIVWEKPTEIPRFDLPTEARMFAAE